MDNDPMDFMINLMMFYNDPRNFMIYDQIGYFD